MRVTTIWRQFAPGLLMLMFLAGRVDARAHRHHHARSAVPISTISTSNVPVVSVPDGGSTLAMGGGAALLLVGYHWLRCKRIAA